MNMYMNLKKKYPIVVYSIYVTPILAFITLFSIGGGHGTVALFKLLYPYSIFAGVIATDNGSSLMETIFFVGFSLYLIYGIILTIAQRYNKLSDTIIMLSAVHLAMSLMCYIFI